MRHWRNVCTILGLAWLGVALQGGSVHASTIIRAKHGNGSLATAQPIGLAPDLVVKQKTPNDTLATAQPVSPTYRASEIVGTVSKRQPEAFFSLAVASGAFIEVHVAAKNPLTQFTELLLYDAGQNLVAIASGNDVDGSSSVISFVVPTGGTWTVEVTGAPTLDPKAAFFKYDLRILSPIVYAVDVLGTLGAKGTPGYYRIAAQAGDHLHLHVGALKPPTGQPELLLYDAGQNLVAIANGNGADGISSVIDFTVPGGGGGDWTAEVTGSPSADPATNHFTYDLQIQGATGTGPVVPK